MIQKILGKCCFWGGIFILQISLITFGNPVGGIYLAMKDLVIRLKQFLDHKGIGIIDLSVVLGYNSPQKLYRLFNTENASPSVQIIEDVSNKFEDLNLNWLFTGKGKMLNPGSSETDFKEKYLKCLEEKELLYQKLLPS